MEWFWGELLLEVSRSSKEKMAMIISASSGVCSMILGTCVGHLPCIGWTNQPLNPRPVTVTRTIYSAPT
jgi:hypothetical protein